MMIQKITNFSPEMILFTDGSFQNGISSNSVVRYCDSQYELVYANRLPDNETA